MWKKIVSKSSSKMPLDAEEAFKFLKQQAGYEEEMNPIDKSSSRFLDKWEAAYEDLLNNPKSHEKYQNALNGKRGFVNRAKLGDCFQEQVQTITLSTIKLHYGVAASDIEDAAKRIVNTGWSARQWEMEIYSAIQGDIQTHELVEMKESFEESGLTRTRLYQALLEELGTRKDELRKNVNESRELVEQDVLNGLEVAYRQLEKVRRELDQCHDIELRKKYLRTIASIMNMLDYI